MNKIELLKKRAEEFYFLLEEYAAKDSDVDDFKRRFKPWYEKIMRGEIVPPCYDYKLNAYFTNSDLSPLADKYSQRLSKLGEASAAFTAAVNDWTSN